MMQLMKQELVKRDPKPKVQNDDNCMCKRKLLGEDNRCLMCEKRICMMSIP